MTRNFVADFETLGTTADCIVLSVNVMEFDPFSNMPVMSVSFSFMDTLEEQVIDYGRRIESSTFRWWLQQPQYARDALAGLSDNTMKPFHQVMQDVVNHFRLDDRERPSILWGNGADFDGAIFKSICQTTGVQARSVLPFGVRCARTTLQAFNDVQRIRPPDGKAHCPHEDNLAMVKTLRAVAATGRAGNLFVRA